jgi:outer membrane protein OmpA-like peptidoglycan-associated protein
MRRAAVFLAFFSLIFLLSIPIMPIEGEEFYYKHRTGDRFRILSTIIEDVYVNRTLSHRAEIINRIAVEICDVKGDSGSYKAVFQTAERSAYANSAAGFQWSRDYNSEFDRDRLGILNIDRKYFMPVVRNVPVFPNKQLSPGEKWSADGYEVHDFRDSFGIPEPYKIPFTANYTFLGIRQWKGTDYPAFSVSYRIFDETSRVDGRVWPERIQGASDQIIYWDMDLGQPAAYEEYFRIIMDLSDGRTAEFRGRAEAEIIEAPLMDKAGIAEDIAETLRNLDIPGASVRIDETGVTISIENIQFLPDSSILMQSEKEKLDKIAQILLRYPERDILVAGHTALAGTEAGRRLLSQERAQSVAEYLLEQKVRSPDRMLIQGFGAEKPIADNTTEAGRERNRRVEITILEN